MVADRKFTVDYGENFIFDDKLILELNGHVVVGFSGDRGTFEIFRNTLEDRLEDQKKNAVNGVISTQKFILETSRSISSVNNRFENGEQRFDALVCHFSNSGFPFLNYFYPDGRLEPVHEVKTIGTGAPYGSAFIKEKWNSDLTMEQAAELAVFAIRYIELLQLTHSVGVKDDPPQIMFMATAKDRSKYEGKDMKQYPKELVASADKRIEDFRQYLTKAFPF
jgi:20S proteasome alpha/beta subunit